jgi:TonB family protein
MDPNSSREALIDTIHAESVSRTTCGIEVTSGAGAGVLFLEEGAVVHTAYAGLTGEPAAYRIFKDEVTSHRVTRGVPVPAPNMRVGYQSFVLEILRRMEEGSDADEALPAKGAGAATSPAPQPPRRRFRGTAGLLAATIAATALVIALVMAARVQVQHVAAKAAGPGATPEAALEAGALEAGALAGPDVAPPELLSGTPPASPEPGFGPHPVVVCRVLVAADGHVARAEVLQRQPELASYEEAALAAVKDFRFLPARKDGTAVAAWVNWPVPFR